MRKSNQEDDEKGMKKGACMMRLRDERRSTSGHGRRSINGFCEIYATR